MTCRHLTSADSCPFCALERREHDALRTGARPRYRKGNDRADSVRALERKLAATRKALRRTWKRATKLLEG